MCYTRLCLFYFYEGFFALLPNFSPPPLKFQRMKKNPVNIIILHKCTKNRNHMLWGSWHMEYNGCNYFSFWAIFCAFPLLTNQNIKISKNWNKQKEKNLEISSTAWKLSKYSVYSGPYSPTFGLNTERYLSIFPFSVWMRENTD